MSLELDELVGPSEGGCHICWRDEEAGLMVKDPQIGVWVHQSCLDFFGIEDVVLYERQYYDI